MQWRVSTTVCSGGLVLLCAVEGQYYCVQWRVSTTVCSGGLVLLSHDMVEREDGHLCT